MAERGVDWPVADYMVRATAGGGSIRAFACTTTGLCEEARRRHGTYPTATAALGRALTAVAMMGATLKDRESITLRVDGGGPLGSIVVDGDAQGLVRGYVRNPRVDLDHAGGKLDVGGAVGRNGYLHVTRDLSLREMYTGTAELVTGEIAEDLTYYLTKSEQVPSAVALGVLIDTDATVLAAGGYMLQLLPAVTDDDRSVLEENLRALGAVSRAVDAGQTPGEMLETILRGLEHHVLERRDLHFACRCSRERALDTLATLTRKDLEEMLQEDRGAELGCHFCGEFYRFSAEDLSQLLGQRA